MKMPNRHYLYLAAMFVLMGASAQTDGAQWVTEGGRNDVSSNGQWVFFDRVTSKNPYEMEIFRIGIADKKSDCLTCDLNLPLVIGQPLVHPSGKGLLFQGLSHTATLKPRSHYYHPSWGFHNDFYWLEFATMEAKLILDCSKEFGNGFGAACLHPQFSPDGQRLLFSSRRRAGLIQNPWEWWTPAIADFHPSNRTVSNVQEVLPRKRKAFYETHQLFSDGRFLYSLGPGQYPQGAYMYEKGVSTAVYAPDNGDWVEHAHLLPDGRMLLNASNGMWEPRTGIARLKMELHMVEADGLIPLTNHGLVTSDYSCYRAEFCVVQVADLGDPQSQPQLYKVKIE